MAKSDFKKEDAILSIKLEDKKALSRLIATIKKSPAYQDEHCRVIIENDAIYIGHSLGEIEASFPEFKAILLDNQKRLTEKNLAVFDRFNCVYKHGDREKLEKEAKVFIANLQEKKVNPNAFAINPAASPDEQLLDLVSKNDGLVLGEAHKSRASKKIFFDNMGKLKAAGVNTIYMEHLLSETHQKMLDEYLSNPKSKMPKMLKDYLERLDKGNSLQGPQVTATQPYSFLGLVMQAKKYGVKIVTFDTVASYVDPEGLIDDKGDFNNRCLLMNYLAAQTISKHQVNHPEKYIVFCGSKHINKVNSDVPGMMEILGVPTLVVESISSSNSKFAKDHPAKPNVLIRMAPTLGEEAKLFLHDFKKWDQAESKFSQSTTGVFKKISKKPSSSKEEVDLPSMQQFAKNPTTDESHQLMTVANLIKTNYDSTSSDQSKRKRVEFINALLTLEYTHQNQVLAAKNDRDLRNMLISLQHRGMKDAAISNLAQHITTLINMREENQKRETIIEHLQKMSYDLSVTESGKKNRAQFLEDFLKLPQEDQYKVLKSKSTDEMSGMLRSLNNRGMQNSEAFDTIQKFKLTLDSTPTSIKDHKVPNPR